MVKPENINSRNIKYFEIKDHNGEFDTYFKWSNKWYRVNHITGYIQSIGKMGFEKMDNVIYQTIGSRSYRIFEPSEKRKYDKTPTPGVEHVIYDTKMGNPHFIVGDSDTIDKVTARYVVKNYTKLKHKFNN